MTSKTKSGGIRHEITRIERKVKSKYIVRVVAGVLTIALVGTGIGATAVFAEKNSTAVTAEADSTTGSSKDADDIADKLMDSVSLKDNDADKDESVYLISDANGNVNKTIVVDHLKNKDKKDTLEDASNLSDIENVKGKENSHKAVISSHGRPAARTFITRAQQQRNHL